MKGRRETIIADSRWADKDHLFYYPPCDVPAWDPLIDEMVELVEEWNEHEKNKLRFFQIKEKFGRLTVYLESLSDLTEVPTSINDAVQSIANEAHKICKLCRERKVETVVESLIQWRCLDHWEDRRA